jgi:hypothetical protein
MRDDDDQAMVDTGNCAGQRSGRQLAAYCEVFANVSSMMFFQIRFLLMIFNHSIEFEFNARAASSGSSDLTMLSKIVVVVDTRVEETNTPGFEGAK